MSPIDSRFDARRRTTFKILRRYFSSRWTVVVAGIVALLPAIVCGIPAGHDLPNHLKLAIPFYNAIQSGRLYPAWLAEANHGFGDTSLRFYPPALYYLMAATRGLAGNWYAGFLIAFVLLSVLGALGVYFWARSLFQKDIAVWAGILYAFVPYRLNEFYGASLLAEYAAGAVLPFAFAFVLRTCRDGRARDIAGLALCFALLVLSNLPLTVIGSLALLFYALLTIEKSKLRQSLSRLCLGVALGLAASAVYWTTMLAEISWIRKTQSSPYQDLVAYFDYRRNFVFSPFSLGNTNSWLSNMLMLATLSMALAPFLMFFWRGWKLDRQMKGLFALLGISLLMTTDLSRPLWIIIPKLKEVQFPWRWLVVSSILVPVITAASIPFCRQRLSGKLRPLALIALGGALVSVAYSGARMRDANYLPHFEFDTAANHLYAEDSLEYWLPVWVNERPRPMPNAVEAKDREVRINSWEAEQRWFWVGPGPAEEIRLRTFYYPHWVASAAGKPLASRPAADGAMLISIPGDAASIKLQFHEPGRVRAAAVVSALGWTMIFLLLAYGWRSDPKQSPR